MNGSAVAAGLLALAVAGSALALVYSQHQSRVLFAELEELHRTRDALNAEWGMLRLEQGAWATHGRVERLAREELDMTLPRQEDIMIVYRSGDRNRAADEAEVPAQ